MCLMFVDMMFLNFNLCQIGVLEVELCSGYTKKLWGRYGEYNVATAAKGT